MEYNAQKTRREILAKVRYMSNEQVQQLVEESESNLFLNKTILLELISSKRPLLSSHNTTFTNILSRLSEEGERTSEKIEEELQNWREAAGRTLINAQLANELLLKAQKLGKDHKDKVWELKYQIERKENFLALKQERREEIEEELKALRNRQFMVIAPPVYKLIEEHNEVESYRDSMRNTARQLYSVITYNNTLKLACQELNNEVNAIRTLLSNPINRRHGITKADFTQIHRRQFTIKRNEFDESFNRSEPSVESESTSIECSFFQEETHVKILKEKVKVMKNEFEKTLEDLLSLLKENKEIGESNDEISDLYEKFLMVKGANCRDSVLVNEFANDKIAFCVPIDEEEEVEVNANSLYG